MKETKKYRTQKIPLKSLLINGQNYELLYDAISRTHKATIYVYQFLRAFILKEYSDTGEIMIINDAIVSMAYRTIFTDSNRGPKLKASNEIIFNKFKSFYNDEFKDLIGSEKINGKYLSEIVMYSCTDIVKNIENNIKINFSKYFRTYVNQCTKEIISDELSKLGNPDSANTGLAKSSKRNLSNPDSANTGLAKSSKRNQGNDLKDTIRAEREKELYSNLSQMKQDLLNGTSLCTEDRFNKWAEENKVKILPTQFKESIEHDIQIEPFKYLKFMLEMNKTLEVNKLKTFQFFPLRTNIVPKYIQLDTKSLVEIFIRKDKNQYLDKLTSFKDQIWNMVFQMDNSIFKQKWFTFDYCISTDGYCASIRFINNKYIADNNKKKAKLKQGKLDAKKIYDNLTEEEVEQIKKQKEDAVKNKKSESILKQKGKFKKLGKEEKELVMQEKKEFQYINKLKGEVLEKVKKSKKIYVDPGRRSILYMMDDDNVVFNYTNRQHLKETKRLKYSRLIENYKSKNKITEEEDKLTKYNSKTCDYEKFKEYIKVKSEMNRKLFKIYEDEYFRKLKWFTYINKKRSEDNLLNEIEYKYGKDITIIIGDCCENNKGIKYISTPNKSIKRKLKERFPVYLIDEFRTSVLNHLTEERQENLYLKDLTGRKRKIHSVLMYKTESGRLGCINRDRNAVLNIKKLVNHYMETGKRIENYSREKVSKRKVSKKKKVSKKSKKIQPSKDREMNSRPINSNKDRIKRVHLELNKKTEFEM